MLLAGCGQAAAGSAPEAATPSAPVTDDATVATSAAPAQDWCADPAVAALVEETLASDTEGQPMRILVSPEEMKEMGDTDADIAGQLRVW